jgi:hypothetical protein
MFRSFCLFERFNQQIRFCGNTCAIVRGDTGVLEFRRSLRSNDRGGAWVPTRSERRASLWMPVVFSKIKRAANFPLPDRFAARYQTLLMSLYPTIGRARCCNQVFTVGNLSSRLADATTRSQRRAHNSTKDSEKRRYATSTGIGTLWNRISHCSLA